MRKITFRKSQRIIFLFLLGIFITACKDRPDAYQPPTAVDTVSGVIQVTQTTTPSPLPTPIPAQNGWTPEFTATISSKEVEDYTQEEIAKILFTQWLDHFKTQDADSQHRLSEYELLKVETPNSFSALRAEEDVDFIATISFSVKPSAFMFSSWVAGNGTVTDQAWIRNKFLFTGVKKDNNLYSLKILGTGP